MKIVLVVGNLANIGGTERVTCELATEFYNQGHDVEIVSTFGPSLPYFHVPYQVTRSSLGMREAQGNIARLLRNGFRLERWLRRANPDAVIMVDTVLAGFICPWSFRRKYKLIAWEHFSLSTDHGTVLRSLGRLLATRLSDAVVVLTERDREAWFHRFQARNVCAIPNPAPNLIFPDPQPRLYRTVLAVGRLTYQKGFDVLLNAWSQVRDFHDEWRLRILGEGELRPELEDLTARLDLQSSVEMPGICKDIAAEYANAHALVMTSRWEGLPMTLLEALQAGLPIVATDCPTGPREVLSQGGGILVPVDLPNAVADALRNIMKSDSFRQILSAQARAAAARYNTKSIATKWTALLETTRIRCH